MIVATVTSSSPQTNTATITGADQFDPIIANNTAAVLETPQLADLALSKTVDDPRPNVGDVIAFTVTLGNSGPNNATNVRVTDLLPAGLSFVSDTPSQGTYNPTTGLWTVGTVSTTVPQTLLIRARVIGPGAQTNAADDHPLRPVRPQHRQQHGHRHRDPAAGRPQHLQDRRQAQSQRRRHDHLHHHAERQRPRFGDQRAGDRPPATRSLLPEFQRDPGHL